MSSHFVMHIRVEGVSQVCSPRSSVLPTGGNYPQVAEEFRISFGHFLVTKTCEAASSLAVTRFRIPPSRQPRFQQRPSSSRFHCDAGTFRRPRALFGRSKLPKSPAYARLKRADPSVVSPRASDGTPRSIRPLRAWAMEAADREWGQTAARDRGCIRIASQARATREPRAPRVGVDVTRMDPAPSRALF